MIKDAKWYAYWLRLLPASTPDEKMRTLEAADMLEQLEAALPKWISADKPPEHWENENDGTLINYFVLFPDCGVEIGSYVKTENRWFVLGIPVMITHWMPLPEPPKE